MEPILDNAEGNSSSTNFNYAGFWIRFGAYFIDAICLAIVQVAVAFIATGTSGFGVVNAALSVFNFLLGIFYFVLMESSSYQATLGKMAVGIKVVDLEGQRISFGRALGRYFAKFISAIILLIGFIMAGFDAKKQALHDKIAKTYVINN